MKHRGRVFVIQENGLAVRIVRHPTYDDSERLVELPRAQAVAEIRRQVFERATWRCEKCGRPLTWETGHMDERIPKGKGGEVSVANGQMLCADCHIGPSGKHGNRFPRWSKGVTHELAAGN